MIEVTGKLRPEDYVRAQYLHLRPRLAYKVLGALILIIFAWAAWYTFIGSDDPFVIADLLLPAGLIYIVFFFFVYIPWKTRRAYKQQKALQRKLSMRFEESGLSVHTEHSDGTTPWSDFLKWKENSHLFLVYLSDCLYFMIPKRMISGPDDVERIRQTLLTKISQDAA